MVPVTSDVGVDTGAPVYEPHFPDIKRAPASTTPRPPPSVIFQDELRSMCSGASRRASGKSTKVLSRNTADERSEDEGDKVSVDALFFEIANAPTVGYRCSNGTVISILQDPLVEDCTGGVVWETAFALSQYLTKHAELPFPSLEQRPVVLELGAGYAYPSSRLTR